MKKANNKYFGIYINNKIPKLKNKENKYYYCIKTKFDGKAFVLDDNKDIKEELENGKRFNKKGKHIIKFINKKNQIYYIKINIVKLWIIWLFLFAFLLLLGLIFYISNNNTPKSNYSIQEVFSYDIEMQGLKYVFNVDYKNNNFQNIKLTDKVSSEKMIYPGSNGSLYIVINTKNGNKDIDYKLKILEETEKPKNLKFKIYGNTYNSFTELAEDINGKISKNAIKTLKIDWFWNYETDDDTIDTIDGMNFENYRILLTMIGTEGG